MAAARKPYDAITLFARPFIRHMDRLREVEHTILDLACQEIWLAAPWRWSLGLAETLTLTASVQDIPFTTPPAGPSDLLYFAYVYLTDGIGPSRVLEVVPSLPADANLKGQPSQVAFVAGSPAKMRLFPCPPSFTNTTRLISVYKKTAPVITRTNMHTAGVLVMDDDWFHVYCALVLFYAYKYADDPRAQAQYQEFQLRLAEMRKRERMPEWLSRNMVIEQGQRE